MIDNTDLDDLTQQLDVISDKLSQQRRALDETRQQRVVDAVLNLPDGVWLVRAREILAKFCGSRENSSHWGNGATNIWNLCQMFDDFLRFYEEDQRKQGTPRDVDLPWQGQL